MLVETITSRRVKEGVGLWVTTSDGVEDKGFM